MVDFAELKAAKETLQRRPPVRRNRRLTGPRRDGL
jgi:hypothetical protein